MQAAGIALAGAALGAVATKFLGGKEKSGRRYGRDKEHNKAFVLIVTVTFKTVEAREKAIELFKPLAKYVAENEPGTLTYEASRCDQNGTKLFFSERYKRREDYELHRTSKAFKTFFEEVGKHAEVVAKDGISGYEVDYGFA